MHHACAGKSPHPSVDHNHLLPYPQHPHKLLSSLVGRESLPFVPAEAGDSGRACPELSPAFWVALRLVVHAARSRGGLSSDEALFAYLRDATRISFT